MTDLTREPDPPLLMGNHVRHAARVALLLALALGACEHTAPPSAPDPEPRGAFNEAAPLRLTFNPGFDGYPSFSDDGEQIVYTYAPVRPDRDRCIGVLPATGGMRVRELCETRVAHSDSSDALAWGALADDGRLLFIQTTSRVGAQVPGFARLLLDVPGQATPRLIATTPIPLGGAPATWLEKIRWTADDDFVAMGVLVQLVPNGSIFRDTLYTPISVVRGSTSIPGGAIQPIAGTGGARSFSITDDGTTIIVAIGANLFTVPVAGGSPVMIASAPGVINDVDCRGDTCVVIVGGNRLFSVPITGGTLSLVPATGAEPWSRVSLSPTTHDIVVTGTSANGQQDLYLFRGLL